MANNSMTIVLPNREEMLRRLQGVSTHKTMLERVYPVVLAYAGKEMAPEGVVNLLIQAMSDYAEKPSEDLADTLLSQIPVYINALLDDERERRAALEDYASGMSR